MSKLIVFLFSRDGIITLTTLILLIIVNKFNNPYHPWINFLARAGTLCVFSYILWRSAGKKIIDFLSQRQRNIITKFEELKKQKQDAQLQLIEIEQHMADIETEKETILSTYYTQAEKLQSTITHETEKRITYIHNQSKSATEILSKNVLQQLYNILTDEIILATEIEIKKDLDITKQHMLIDNALKKVIAFD